ncbi:MAG: SHOCT domain-containing protein [Thiogranum sp.]|nr:SHOCT domain-containing protein [Thiogranum sp.]
MPYGLGWIFMILFWVLVIAGVIALVRWLTAGPSRREQGISTPAHRTPTDILRERYARGEIDREEFLQRLEDLNGN